MLRFVRAVPELLRAVPPRAVLVTTWLIAIVYAFPGYMSYDSAEQLIQLRQHRLQDFHPPLLAAYWRAFEFFVSGPVTLLVLQISLFVWGLYHLLRLRFADRTAAWLAAAVMLFPPVFTPMAPVWKDAQMAGFLVAGTVLALRSTRWSRIAGVALLVLAAGIRHNGGATLPFLVFLVVSTWTARRFALRLAIVAAALAAVFVVTTQLNRAFTDLRMFSWYRTTAMFDVTGTVCNAPPLSDAEVVELLDGVTLLEHDNLQQRYCAAWAPGKRSWYDYGGLFKWSPWHDERSARLDAWWRLVRRFPGAYVRSRLQFAADDLGLLPGVPVWEPVAQNFAANEDQLHKLSHNHTRSPVQNAMGGAFRWLAEDTPLYRTWIYLVLALAVAGWAAWKRDQLVGCVVGSGLLYELSVLVLANSPDFRYGHWMITTACLGAIFAVGARRGRKGEDRPAVRQGVVFESNGGSPHGEVPFPP